MVHLVYSNRPEQLLRRFVENAQAWRRSTSPYEPLRLITPNKAVETYLRFGLARSTGFAGNIEAQTLRRFVQGVLPEDGTIRVIDAKAFQGFLLALFFDAEALRDPELAPVRDYLYAAGTDDRLVDLRRHQLASQLSRLFDEYSSSRAEVVTAWKEGPVYNDVTERWQRALWLRILERAKAREASTGVQWLTLPQLVQWIDEGNGNVPEHAHIFWVSSVARFFFQVLQVLAKRSALHIYALNPSAAFWDDAESTRGPLSPEGAELVTEENPALRLWGRAGRENVRILNRLADWNHDEAFEEGTESDSLLSALQEDVLQRASGESIAEERAGTEPDESLRILACPTIRREAETIATEIWSLIREDEERAKAEEREPLRFNDIAVFVNPRESGEYFTHLATAFSEAHEIPHCIVDEPFVSSSPAAEAVSLLLELPLSRFTRAELLRLATHPLVMARYPDASADDWVQWCERLGIVHGADRRDHAETYIQHDILNWDQGMRRLALGAFLPGERSGVLDLLSLPQGRYLPEEMTQSNQESAAQFGLVVRSLLSDAKFAREAVLRPDEWLAFFQAMITTYVQTPTPDDERDLARCLTALQDAFALDIDGQTVSYTIAHSLATSALQGLTGTRGSLLARGVVIATPSAVRGVPFRAIFWAGLGEGRFPAADRVDHLDLQRLQQLPGDVSLRDADKYLFLETLLAARERITLSYVSRDALTGETLEPATVVSELKSLLAQGYLGREGVDALVQRLPMHRYGSEREAPHIEIPEASGEYRALVLRQRWRELFGQADRIPTRNQLLERVPSDLRPPLSDMLRLVAPPPAKEEMSEAVLRVPLSALRKFLECPLQGHAQTVLRMGEIEAEDLLAREDEPFETDRLRSSTLLTDVCLKLAAEPSAQSLQAAMTKSYEAAVEFGILSGRMPSGVFNEVERKHHLSQLESCAKQIRLDLAGGGPIDLRIFRFGQAEEHARVDELHAPIELDVDLPTATGGRARRKVQLYGRTDPVVWKQPGSLLLDWRRAADGWPEKARQARKHLRSFLDHVVLTAAGVLPEGDYNSYLYLTGGEESAPARRSFPPLARETAVAYLRALVEDLFSRVHDYTLPCEAVFKADLIDHSGDYASATEMLYGGWSMTPASAYGPVPNPGDYTRLSNSEAAKLVQRRFGLFLGAFSEEAA